MPSAIHKIKKNWANLPRLPEEYRRLKAHLNQQPVGFPSTLTGVENRLLTEIFTLLEARIALSITYRFDTLEAIFARLTAQTMSLSELNDHLMRMEKKGCIFMRIRDGVPYFALHPLVIGMFEVQVKRMTAGYYLDTTHYAAQRYALEFLTTKAPQMRVVPIRKSLSAANNIAAYDEIRTLVDQARAPLHLIDCICKTGKDLIDQPCRKTDRREICLLFRDFAAMSDRHHMGRAVSKEEVFEMLDQSEKEGLMLMPSNMREPQVVCSCCGCCCGVTSMIKAMPKPADFVVSNFVAQLVPAQCIGCKKCVKRCQMKAIKLDPKTQKPLAVDPARCIGCGACIPSCKTGALKLTDKPRPVIPPKDHDELFDLIAGGKKNTLEQLMVVARSFAAAHLKKGQS